MPVFAKKAARIIEGCFVVYFALAPVLNVLAQTSVQVSVESGIQEQETAKDERYSGVEPGSWQERILDELTPKYLRNDSRTDIDYPVDTGYLKGHLARPIEQNQGQTSVAQDIVPARNNESDAGKKDELKPTTSFFNAEKYALFKTEIEASASQSAPIIQQEQGRNTIIPNQPEIYYIQNSASNPAVWQSASCGFSQESVIIIGSDCLEYGNNADTWMIYGPFDLSNAKTANLEFQYSADIEEYYDRFSWYASPDKIKWQGAQFSGSTKGASERGELDLSEYAGEKSVWAAFRFQSDSSASSGSLAIDDIRVQEYVDSLPDLYEYSRYAGTGGTYAPGDYISGGISIRNQGSMTAAASQVYYYFQPSGRSYTSQYQVGHDDISSLAFEQYQDATFDWPIPAGTPSGTYYFYYWIDAEGLVTEGNEDNNKGYWTITVEDNPDLTTLNGFISDTTVFPGQTVSISLNVKNQGVGTAGSSWIKFYSRKGALVFDENSRISTRYIPALSSGSFASTGTFHYTFPPDLEPGTYSLYYWIDAEEDVAESDEGNNQGEWTITVSSLPDLYRSAPSYNASTLRPGETFVFDVDIINGGGGDAEEESQVYYYFEQGSCTFSDSYYFNILNVPALGAGLKAHHHVEYTIPGDATPDEYSFCYWIDKLYSVLESNEDNNKYSIPITVQEPLPDPADLYTYTKGLDKLEFEIGEEILGSVTIGNQGEAAAGQSKIYYYFSQDNHNHNLDYQFGDDDVPSLAPGQISTQTFNFTPDVDAPGAYFIYYWIDAGQVVAESDEDNNLGYWEIALTAPAVTGPDLSVSSKSDITGSLARGQTIHGELTIKNIGADSANASKVYYYFKQGEQIYSPAYQVGDDDVPFHASGAEDVETFDWVVPDTTEPASYRFYYQLDAKQEIAEANEDNNFGGWDIVIGSSSLPDLTQNKDADLNGSSFEQGAVLEMDVHLANYGSAGAGSSFDVSYYIENAQSAGTAPQSSPIKTTSFPPMPAGENRDASFSHIFAFDEELGTYRIFYWIDAGMAIAESNESNNIFYRDVSVVVSQGSGNNPGAADLAASAFTVGPLSARLGDAVNVRIDVKNIGSVATNKPGMVRVYFKQSPRLYTSDFEVGSGSFPRLASQSSSSKYFSFTVPDGPVGEYFVYYWIDPDSAIDESDENNNANFKSVDVALALAEVAELRFAYISSPQQIGAPFNATITAYDAQGAVVSGFSGSVGLSSNAGSASVRPSSVNIVNGQWTGEVVMLKASKNIYLKASTSAGNFNSKVFDVASDVSETGSVSGRIDFKLAQSFINQSSESNDLVKIHVDDLAGNSVKTQDTLNHTYSIDDLSIGNYVVYAEHVNSHETSRKLDVNISKSQPKVANFELVLNCPAISDRNPVLLVPGVMGSRAEDKTFPILPAERNIFWNSEKLAIMDINMPFFNTPGWATLKEKLTDPNHFVGSTPYFEGCNLFEVPYDWRSDLDDSVTLYLHPWIREAKQISGKNKVDIIAHSMGGLLARAYIQGDYPNCNNTGCDVDKFVMVGTPNQGSANAYYVWEGGDPWLLNEITGKFWKDNTVGYAPALGDWISHTYWKVTEGNYKEEKSGGSTWKKPFISLDKDDNIKILEWYTGSPINNFNPYGTDAGVIGLKQLLPTYGFLNRGDPDPFRLDKVKNTFLIDLNSDENKSLYAENRFRMKDGTNNTVDTAVFVGINKNTIDTIKVYNSDSSSLYRDGIPIKDAWYNGLLNKIPYLGDLFFETKRGASMKKIGDGTVREDSASLPYDEGWARAKVTAEAEHGGLIKPFADALVKFLKGEVPDGKSTLEQIMGAAAANTVAADEDAPTSILGFSFDGRLTPHIISPSGKQSGIDAGGNRVDEIPDSQINVRSDSGGIKINNPETGVYTLNIYSPYQEDASIHFEYLDAEAMLSKDYRIFTTATSTAYLFTINPENQEKVIINQPISESRNVSAQYINGLTRVQWQAPETGTASIYKVYVKNSEDFYFSQIVETEQLWLDTQDDWADQEEDMPQLYAVSAINSSGKESFMSEVVINNDQDNDGLSDSEEANYGTDTNRADTDGDGLSDLEEITNSTNPLIFDTDLDGYSDFEESEQGTDPLDEESFPPPSADLSVSITPSFSSLPTGNKLDYFITAANNGPSEAQFMVLTDTLPESAVFFSSSASQGSCSHQSGAVTCQIGTLAAGASATGTIAVLPSIAGNITNIITVSGNVTDNNPANNTATTTTQVTAGRPLPPVIASYPSFTNLAQVTISGTKQTNTSIFMNSQEIISRNASTTWEYILSLAEGQNNFSFIAKDGASQSSDPTSITIVRDSIPPVAAEGLTASSTGSSIILSWGEYETRSTSSPEVYISAAGSGRPLDSLEPHVAGEMLVRFVPGKEKKLHTGIMSFLNIFKKEKSIEPIAGGISKVVLKNHDDLEQAIDDYERDDAVLAVSPNYLVSIDAIPNDPDFSQLWGLHNAGQTGGTQDADIDAPEVWDREDGSSNRIIVAVLDTGVDYNHPDLSANIWVNEDEIPNNGIDDDNNGYIDDVRGWDMSECFGYAEDGSCVEPKEQDNDPMDENSHGTHVAGAIGAVGNNNLGIIGVNPNAIIMPIRFMDANGRGTTQGAIEALNYAVANGAKVVNASFGGGGFSQLFFDAVAGADNAGVLLMASAGNESEDLDISSNYPAEYDLENVIAVAASDHEDGLASFSNYGANSVDIAAPGKDILSAVLNGGSALKSGTSMAAPHVAGAASLLLARNPSLSISHVRTALLYGSDAKASLAGKVASGGRLNANQSFEKLLTGIDTASFLVYRKPEPFVSIDGLEPVAVVTQPGARSWEDDTVAPQSEYFYALAVKDPAGNISEPMFSNSAQTGIFLRQGISVGAIVPDYGQGSQSQSLLDIIFNFFRR